MGLCGWCRQLLIKASTKSDLWTARQSSRNMSNKNGTSVQRLNAAIGRPGLRAMESVELFPREAGTKSENLDSTGAWGERPIRRGESPHGEKLIIIGRLRGRRDSIFHD
jgi:hypothetical protein